MSRKLIASTIMSSIDIVTVVNDFQQYEKYIASNEFVNRNNLIYYDNTKENISIPVRYNHYLANNIDGDKWIIFCHQDFFIQEDINKIINDDLDKNNIYGPIGAGTKKQFAFFLRLNGIKIAKLKTGLIDKQIIMGSICEDNGTQQKIAGIKAQDFDNLETVDCCCFIVHSSLLRKINFKFDEILEWHLYAEDLCLYASSNYNIKSNILNIKATHYSSGNFNKGFKSSLDYLIDKYPSKPIVSTCFDGVYAKYLDKL